MNTCFTNYCVCAGKELTKAMLNHDEYQQKWIALKKKLVNEAVIKKKSATNKKRARKLTQHYSPPKRIDLTGTSDDEKTKPNNKKKKMEKLPHPSSPSARGHGSTGGMKPSAQSHGSTGGMRSCGKRSQKKIRPPHGSTGGMRPSARSHGSTGGTKACEKPPQKKIKLSPSKNNPCLIPEDDVRNLEYQGQPESFEGGLLLNRFVTIHRP